jgi:hypothetical protein
MGAAFPLWSQHLWQAKGRAKVFANYRLRVAEVIRDYGVQEREHAPHDSLAAHSRVASGGCV